MSDEQTMTPASPWTVDARGYLLTPSGTKAARLTDNGILMLYEKRTHTEVPLTLADFQGVQTQTPRGDA